MKVSRAALLTAAVLATGVLLWKNSWGQAPVPAAPPAQGPVAVVDVEEVITNYQKAIDHLGVLERRRRSIDAEDQKRKDAIDRIGATLRDLTEDSPEYIKQVAEERRLAVDRDVYLRVEASQLQADHHRLLKGFYDEVSKMAGVVAKERGYKVVLYTSHKMPKTSNSEQLAVVLKERIVLWADPSLDITEGVLKRLNDAQRAAPKQP